MMKSPKQIQAAHSSVQFVIFNWKTGGFLAFDYKAARYYWTGKLWKALRFVRKEADGRLRMPVDDCVFTTSEARAVRYNETLTLL